MLLAVMLMVAFAVPAQTYNVADVPNVRLKDKRMHVSDPEGVLSDVCDPSTRCLPRSRIPPPSRLRW